MRGGATRPQILRLVYSVVILIMRDSAFVILLPLVCLAYGSGCREPDQITRYRVPKQQPAAASDSREMLVAVTEREGKVYFFKIVGSSAQLTPILSQVKRFLQNVQFSADGVLTWQLPPGWTERKGSGMRIATLVLNQKNQSSLEMAISTLRQTNPDWSAYLTSNLNRWRGQLGLPPLSGESADRAFEKLDARDTTIYLAKLEASSANNNAATIPQQPRRPSRSVAGFDASLVRGTPAPGWKPGPVTGMRKACFRLQTDDQALEVTVIPAGGNLLANVNRWRGQLKLDRLNQQQLTEQTAEINAGNLDGQYIVITGAKETILAAIFPRASGGSWFVKLRGDSKLVDAQKASFKSFVASLRFGPVFQ